MEANPVPENRTQDLGERARRELADLTGSTPPAAPPRKRWVPVLAAATVLAAGLGVGAVVLLDQGGPPPSTSDEPFYASTAELEGRADAIVRGTITQATAENRNGYPETVATVDVSAVAKGSLATPLRISSTTPGSGPESAALEVRTEYVFLLEVDGSGPAQLVNSTQGWFRVDGRTVVAAPGNDVGLSPAVLTSLQLGQ